jgi:hypothetical protein
MSVKKTPENDPYRIVTHENGFREWIGTPTEEQENWILFHAVGVNSFSSARSRSADRKDNEDDSTSSKQTEEK